jgi:uncharacterized protein (TIGR02145 family)
MKTHLSRLLPLILLFINAGFSFSQVGINTDGSPPAGTAILDVKSTSMGFLPPRMNIVQRNAISSPAEGLVIYNTDEKALNIYNGTSWGPVVPVTCGNSFTDTRDGKIYPTVQIGTQCWMKQNMNIGTKMPGSTYSSDPLIIEKYCYNDLESNCDVYGGLYLWGEAMQGYGANVEGNQGICPTGWHIPKNAEWEMLTSFLGGETAAGGNMKETGTTHWASPNTGATNSSGFTALPGGETVWAEYGQWGGFSDLTFSASFWSSTYRNTMVSTGPYFLWLSYNDASVILNFDWEWVMTFYGRSVRCIRN